LPGESTLKKAQGENVREEEMFLQMDEGLVEEDSMVEDMIECGIKEGRVSQDEGGTPCYQEMNETEGQIQMGGNQVEKRKEQLKKILERECAFGEKKECISDELLKEMADEGISKEQVIKLLSEMEMEDECGEDIEEEDDVYEAEEMQDALREVLGRLPSEIMPSSKELAKENRRGGLQVGFLIQKMKGEFLRGEELVDPKIT
jgi:hypothetical protein